MNFNPAPPIHAVTHHRKLMKPSTIRNSKSSLLHLSYFVATLAMLTLPVGAQVIYSDDFSSGTLTGYNVVPAVATANNGAVIVNGFTTPANPFSGNAVRVYDLSTSASTTLDRNYSTTATLQFIKFDAAISSGAAASGTEAITFRVTNENQAITSSTNVAFSLDLRMNGDLRVQVGSTGVGTYSSIFDTAGTSISLYINTAASSVNFTDFLGDSLTLNSNQFALYADGVYLSTFNLYTAGGFVAAEGIERFGFTSSSAASGGDYIIDNISIVAIPEPATISGLLAGMAAILAARRHAHRRI